MNEVAFLVGTVVSVGYYFYTVRKERAAKRQQKEILESVQAKGGVN
jgi:preprotein translocase subunit YajC